MTRQKPIRKRTARSEKDHTFELIMQRFDTVDKDNKEIKESVAQHVKDDNDRLATINKTLDKHTTYWGLLTTGATAGGGTFLAWLNKWI